VSLSGTGSPIAALATPVIGPTAVSATAPSSSPPSVAPLYVTSLTVAKRVKRSRAKKAGLTVAMVVADGTQQLQVHVMRRVTAASRHLVFATTVTPSATGAIKLRLRSAKLRSALKVGVYEIEITARARRRRLGGARGHNRAGRARLASGAREKPRFRFFGCGNCEFRAGRTETAHKSPC